MMIETLSADDAALALRVALGPARNWHDFLADCIRDKTDLFGLMLRPVIRIKLSGDRCKRPRYATSEVRTFIISALCLVSRPADTRALRKVKIEIDPAMLALPLEMRRAKPA